MAKKNTAYFLKESMKKQKSIDKNRFNSDGNQAGEKVFLDPGITEKDGWFDASNREIWEGKVVRLGASIMPKEDQMLSKMRRKLMMEGIDVSASDLIRAGLRTLYKRDLQSLNNSIAKLPKPKTGRPKAK